MNIKWFPWIFLTSVFVISFLVALSIPAFPIEESVFAFIIFGLIFSVTAFILVPKARVTTIPKEAVRHEMLLLAILLVGISFSLIPGNKIITFFLPGPYSSSAMLLITLARKLLVFVLFPFAIYYWIGFTMKDFGFITGKKALNRNVWLVFLIMSLLFCSLQLVVGNAAEPIRTGNYSGKELLIGLPLAFLWLCLEAGLVEEFFFRALIQERLSVLTKSPSWGIVFGSLLFGLAHAPGMYFRGAGVSEGLGQETSVASAICYCILVQSAAGLPFAILWSKTKNIWLLIAIHAAADLLPNYSELRVLFGF